MASENNSCLSSSNSLLTPNANVTINSNNYIVSGTSSIDYMISSDVGTTSTSIGSYLTSTTGTYNSPFYIQDNGYTCAKDGEIRIDPENGNSSVFSKEYNKWIDCNIKTKKTKDKNGNIKNIILISFDITVADLKNNQQKRIVLTEKIKKHKNVGLNFINITNMTGATTGFYNLAIGSGTNIQCDNNVIGTGTNLQFHYDNSTNSPTITTRGYDTDLQFSHTIT